jgi:signal transduction histidine kinase
MTYLDVMAHDIGNQLQALKISAELLQTMNRGELGSTVLESVFLSVARCESIISRARDIERLLSLPLEMIDPAKVLLHCVHRAEVELDDAELETHIDDIETPVMADEFLERLFWILIENAYVHNPGTDRRIWLNLTSESGGYTISVGDNGPGIPNGMKKTLFDPTRRPGGVGLHLARHIVNKYGGRLTFGDRVEGSRKQGAEFRIWMPISDREQSAR